MASFHMNYIQEREQVLETIHKLASANLIRLSAGNVSIMADDGNVVMTPSALRYDQLDLEDLVVVDANGTVVEGERTPTSEVFMHTIVLNQVERARVAIHSHSPFAITFAVLGMDIPDICLETVSVGAPIPCAEWGCPGTPAPGFNAAALFNERPRLKCVLLRNHGLLTIGATLEQAYGYALEAEIGMQVYHQALQIGTPNLLSDAQIQEIRNRYPNF